MAEKRMFSKRVVDSDDFLDMPASSQALYFHLSMNADDDGFVNNPGRILRMLGFATKDDLQILVAKQFLIPFDSGVLVIRHWRVNNYLRNDRYKETPYAAEKAALLLDDGGVYQLNNKGGRKSIKQAGIPAGIPNDNQLATTGIPSIEEYRENREGESITTHAHAREISEPEENPAPSPTPVSQESLSPDSILTLGDPYLKNVHMKKSEYDSLCGRFGKALTDDYCTRISGFIATSKKDYASHYAAVIDWINRDVASGKTVIPEQVQERKSDDMPMTCPKCHKPLTGTGSCADCNLQRERKSDGTWHFYELASQETLETFKRALGGGR